MLSTVANAAKTRPLTRRWNEWTLREHEVVVTHWPDKKAIKERLPHRTVASIVNFAGKCHLRKQVHQWTNKQDALLRQRVREGVPRREIAAELGIPVAKIANRMGTAKLRYPRRPPKPTGHHLMDELRTRQFVLNVSSYELDASCCTGKIFQTWSPARKINIKHIKKAVAAVN